jgi:hypothetical protein
MPKLPPPARSSRSLPAPTRTTQPSISPVAAPFEPRPAPFEARPAIIPAHTPAPVIEPKPRTGSKPAVKRKTEGNPFVAKPVTQRAPTVDVPGDSIDADNWFEASRAVDRVDIDLTWNADRIAMRERTPMKLAKKLAVPIAVALAIGVSIGGFLAYNGQGNKAHAHAAKQVAAIELPVKAVDEPAPAPIASHESGNAATATAGATQPQPPAPGTQEIAAAAAAPAAAPAPAPAAAPAAVPTPVPAPTAATAAVATTPDAAEIREVKTTRGVVKLVNVRIDSKPAGATVMLVDNGKTSLLGTAPVVASVDPSRSYDVVFTLEGRGTQMLHLDPTKTHRLEVAMHHGSSVAKAAPAPAAVAAAAPAAAAPAPVAAPAPKAKKPSAPIAKLAEPAFDAPPASEAPAAAASGNGTLMVSSKPPCSILVDGKDTGLKTPQKALSLSAGNHKITFVNADADINKTVPITITADHTAKLIQNLMK